MVCVVVLVGGAGVVGVRVMVHRSELVDVFVGDEWVGQRKRCACGWESGSTSLEVGTVGLLRESVAHQMEVAAEGGTVA